MKVRSRFLCTATLLVLAPACARAATKDACAFLTPSEAQAAIGEPVRPTQAEDRSYGEGEGSSCRYRSTVGRALSSKSVSLDVRHINNDLTGSIGGIGENLKSAGFKNVHEVAGLGSAAIWGTNSILGRTQGELTVIQGKSVMLIIIIDGIADDGDALARAKVIAGTALGRL